MAERDDEFYVGYVETAPAGVAAHVRLVVAGIFLFAAVVAIILVQSQRRFAPSVYEFGEVLSFAGLVTSDPYPTLWVARPGRKSGVASVSGYGLVATGKFGAAKLVEGFDGEQVRLLGTLIYRDDRTMIEVADGSLVLLDETDPEWRRVFRPPLPTGEGRHTLVGEIVDAKCFLGVMKPGNLKPHRACAARCISGGVQPVLVVRDAEGRATYYLLVSATGQPVNDAVLDMIAEPVEITGKIVRYADTLVLAADPSSYRRLR